MKKCKDCGIIVCDHKQFKKLSETEVNLSNFEVTILIIVLHVFTFLIGFGMGFIISKLK